MTHPGQMLKAHGLYAGKELGQNFLSNPGTAEMIVSKTGITGQTRVLEIGPGLGAITLPIARTARKAWCVEKDSRLVPILEKRLSDEKIENVTLINQDILKVDICELARDDSDHGIPDQKIVVIGNLPYNISSQILIKLVNERHCIQTAFLMFQKELATRILAVPGSKAYSRLSAVVQYAARINFVANIGPSSFFPKPEVDSTILRFDFFEPGVLDHGQEQVLFDVIKAAFSKRRKSLKNSMVGGEFGYEKAFIVAALERSGIDAARRAETLSVEEFVCLARSIWESA